MTKPAPASGGCLDDFGVFGLSGSSASATVKLDMINDCQILCLCQ
jgi:hypothetical protein